MSDVTVYSASSQFIDTCEAYQRAHGYKPARALIGKKFFERLVEEVGPLLARKDERFFTYNGVKLEVAGE